MRINAIDLRQLRYFIAVAEELHFGRAARRLNMSQPPLSQQIMALEEHLDVMLFQRTKRHVALTPAGLHLLPEARRILRDMERLAEQTREAQRGLTGHLRIGANFSAPMHPFTSRLLQRFQQHYPHIGIELVLYELPSILQLVDIQAYDLDAALVWLDEGHLSPNIVRFDLARDMLCVALPLGHPLARKQKIAAIDLQEEAMIAPPAHAGTQLYDGIRWIFAALGSQPRIVYESPNMPFSLNMVAAGQGIAILPEFLQKLPVSGVVYRPLVVPRSVKKPSMTMNLIAPRLGLKATTAHFIEVAKKLAKE